jgi:hypothetical protein
MTSYPLEHHHGVLDLFILVVDEHGAEVGVGAGLGALLIPVDRLELLFERDDRAMQILRGLRQKLGRLVEIFASHAPGFTTVLGAKITDDRLCSIAFRVTIF